MKISQKAIDSLVEKAQQGDVDAFSILYDQLLDPIFRFCFFKVSTKEIAEDITSDVFLTVWDKLSSYKKSDTIQFSAWVFRIAHNKLIDFYRKNNDTLELREELELPSTTFEESTKKIENEFLRKDLLLALESIPKTQAESIILKYFSELENHEIAEIMEKSETAIRILQSRGLKTLRTFLETQEKEHTKREHTKKRPQKKKRKKKKK